MIPISIIACCMISAYVAYRFGYGEGYDNGAAFRDLHRNDPVIPPGGSLPYNITKARQ